jgi:hypothetical protein
MKVSGVSKEELKLLAQAVNLLVAGEYNLGGKDLCAGADAIRWVQKLAVLCSEAYQAEQAEGSKEKTPDTPKPEAPLKIKAYHPGKVK